MTVFHASLIYIRRIMRAWICAKVYAPALSLSWIFWQGCVPFLMCVWRLRTFWCPVRCKADNLGNGMFLSLYSTIPKSWYVMFRDVRQGFECVTFKKYQQGFKSSFIESLPRFEHIFRILESQPDKTFPNPESKAYSQSIALCVSCFSSFGNALIGVLCARRE